jgi:hypothetical protein
MNEIFSPPQQRPTTQAADGLPRWRWTVAEVERMTAAGYFHESQHTSEPNADEARNNAPRRKWRIRDGGYEG